MRKTMSEKIIFSVFTPVYNRKHTVNRVWESLQNQTYRNFEWIVVDDGSTDGVWDLLQRWKKEADFPVTLLQQGNKGKHVAWNKAVEVAQGELFVPADSDDSFIAVTLERFAYHWDNSISQNDRYKYSGINVLCKDPLSGKIIGNSYPEDLFISNNLDLYFKHKVYGEKWGCIRTDVLKERPFKEVKGAFLSENWIWFYIARKYIVLCVNEALRNYYTDGEVCLTKTKAYDLSRSAESSYTSVAWDLNANFDYIAKYESLTNILKRFVKLWRFAFLADVSIKKVLSESSDNKISILLLIFLIPSYFIYFVTFKRIKNNVEPSVQPDSQKLAG